jgi:hypothetical protein
MCDNELNRTARKNKIGDLLPCGPSKFKSQWFFLSVVSIFGKSSLFLLLWFASSAWSLSVAFLFESEALSPLGWVFKDFLVELPVAHICNPRYTGGVEIGRIEIQSYSGQIVHEALSKIRNAKKDRPSDSEGSVSAWQAWGSEFKLQYNKKREKKKGLKLSLVNGFMFLAFAGEVLVLGFELSASLLQGKPLYYLSDTSSLMLPIFKRHFCTILVGKLWCRKKFYKLFK